LIVQVKFFLLINRQGKVRLAKWYELYEQQDKNRIIRDVSNLVLNRKGKTCNFLDWRTDKVIYKRYASLYFITCVDSDDNELLTLEMIHHFVEILDKYFGNVCELDLIFNFHKAYYLLDEVILAGELQESSRKAIKRACDAQDSLMTDEFRDDDDSTFKRRSGSRAKAPNIM